MSERENDVIIRRILVALDASPHSEAALQAAAQLAAHFSAELEGLFVEDANLFRLVELPFTHEVGFFSTRRRRLDGEELARQLRAQARRLRRRLTEVAEDAHLQWTFRVARGAIAKELLAASTDVDMVILGRSGWSIVRRRRLGSTARAVVFGAPALTLLLQDGTCLGLPVMVVYDGSQMAQRALVAAAVLARAQKGSVTVALVDGREEGEELRRRAAAQLKPHEIQARYRLLTHANVNKLVQRVTSEGCGTLVLPLKTELLHEEALVELLDEIDIPTLFVR